MSRHTYALALLPALLLAAPVARAQAKADEVFAKAFFDPQLVLKHASAIGLTAQQRKAILDELKSTQVALVPLQVDMAEPALELQGLVESTRVDEARALARIDQVLKIENEVKKRQAIFVIRVKNLLTADQQAKLRALRDGGAKEDDADGGGGLAALSGLDAPPTASPNAPLTAPPPRAP
jgi:Spy/CpxP family protein refolding chaperone